ncbi:hypothetical protein HK101_006655 [Irineochytrium annulatum]|nr:hypothetical protein HK101_006655 [Irineochytrium annulatum]
MGEPPGNMKFLEAALESLGIVDETYSEYIAQLSESDIPTKEKKEIILDKTVEPVVDDILRHYDEVLRKREEEARQVQEQLLEKAKEKESQALAETVATTGNKEKVIRSKEEQRKRDRLLATYGFDVDEIVENENGEAEVLYKGKEEEKVDHGLMKNDNAQKVKDAEQTRRAKMQKVLRDQAALKKQLEDKEKEKRRVQKQEKRRM